MKINWPLMAKAGQAALLVAIGVGGTQGYHMAKPKPAEVVKAASKQEPPVINLTCEAKSPIINFPKIVIPECPVIPPCPKCNDLIIDGVKQR
jgi:DNA-binding MurR/RpiR family transcriptional regulator